MSPRELGPVDEELGCQTFGHLASPFVDSELPAEDLDRFETHLPGCDPCRRIVDAYRGIDALAASDIPSPSQADWDAAWTGIEAGLAEERERAASSPFAGIEDAATAWKSRLPRAARPLMYLAAAIVVAVSLQAVRRASQVTDPGEQVATSAEPPKVLSIACKSPNMTPVVQNLGTIDEPITVVQCIDLTG